MLSSCSDSASGLFLFLFFWQHILHLFLVITVMSVIR